MPDTSLQRLPESYTWGFAGAPIQIHLNIDLVSRLRRHIQDSEEMPGLPLACGLLTGDAQKPGITTILDFEPLQTLTAASVEEVLEGVQGEVVGFYRATSAGLDSMTDDDKALAKNLFRHPSSVFLLVGSGGATAGQASFCFWGGGKIFDFPVMAFPLDAAELASREEKRRLTRVSTSTQSSPSGIDKAGFREEEKVPSAGTLAKAPTQQPAVWTKREPFMVGWMAPALVTLVLASLLVAAYLYSRRGSTPPVAQKAASPATEVPPSLGLSVERRGKDLRVSWNGNAERILKAEFGMLLVRGSTVSRDVPLTAEELRAGSVVYASAVDQLRFQLNVVGGGQVTREFLTIVLPQEGEIVPVRANGPRTPGGNVGASPVPEASVPAASGNPRELRQFKETRSPAAVTHQGLDEPPSVSGTAPVGGVNPSLLNHPAAAPPPPVSAPAPADVPAQGTRPALPSASDSGAQPPIATSQVVPPVPALLRGMIVKPTTVDVNVAVDASGKVLKAEATAKPGLHPLLREAAVQAALRWKFKPAQFDGHAVPASVVLQFNFAPNR